MIKSWGWRNRISSGSSIEGVLGGEARAPDPAGLNFVEAGAERHLRSKTWIKRLTRDTGRRHRRHPTGTGGQGPCAMIAQLWALREKAVGLLGRLARGGKQGTASSRIRGGSAGTADYVAEFRAPLDRCRPPTACSAMPMSVPACKGPALDMRDPADAALIRPFRTRSGRPTRKMAVCSWGEHGGGSGGQYSPFFFAPSFMASCADQGGLRCAEYLQSWQARGAAPTQKITALTPFRCAVPSTATISAGMPRL